METLAKPKERVRVLLVEEDEERRRTTRRMLSATGEDRTFDVDWTATFDSALEKIQSGGPDVCLVDTRLGRRRGLEFLSEARERGCPAPIVLMTDEKDEALEIEAIRAGAAGLFSRSAVGAPDLGRSIGEAIERHRAARALRFTQFALDRAADCVFVVDEQARPLYVNQAACDTLGYSRAELLKMKVSEINPEMTDERWRAVFDSVRRVGKGRIETVHRTKNGTLIPVEVTANLLRFDGREYNCAIVRDISDRKKAEREARERTRRLERQKHALIALTKNSIFTRGDPQAAARVLTRKATETLEVARASIWLFDRPRTFLRCVTLFDREAQSHCARPEIEIATIPRYVQALEESRTLVIEDGRGDPRTRVFWDEKIVSDEISSVLSASIHVAGHLVGVVCNAHTGPPRRWTDDEESFAGSIADFFTIALEAEERRRADEALRRQQAEQRIIFDSVPAAIIYKDLNNNYLRLNEAAARSAGMTVEELEGRPVGEIFPEEATRFRREDLQIVRTGKPIRRILETIRLPTGQERSFATDKIPHFDEEGKVDGIVIFAIDITEQKQAERALRDSEAENRALIEAIPDQLYRIRRDGTILNHVAHDKDPGLPPDSRNPSGRNFADLVSADAAREAIQCIERALTTQRTQVFDYSLPSGKEQRHYEGRVVACAAGEVLMIVRDITERKRAEGLQDAALRRSERSRDDMLSILDRLSMAVMTIDEQGKVRFASRTCCEILRREPRKIIGRSWAEVCRLRATDQAEVAAMVELPPDRRTKLTVQLDLPADRGTWVELEVRDDPREPQRKIFFLRDTSEVHDLRLLLDEKAQFQDLIGQSPPMKLVYRQIGDVAAVETTVLIEGATGTGKELVARAIHSLGPRRARPFLAVNCAALSDSLLEGQLFGHRRGAFTGAVENRPGVFEAAEGGTIFLDEIGDVPMNVQTRLLRVLQEREVTRLGESKARKVDVRVVAATQHDLGALAAQGSFRADLLYRVRVARIQLPALRDRLDDIPLLVAAFLARGRAATGKPVHGVSREVMREFWSYGWPGNVRELQSAIESGVIATRGSAIEVEHLPPEIPGSAESAGRILLTPADERAKITSALKATGGNRKAAAELLRISRATLYRKLKRLGLQK